MTAAPLGFLSVLPLLSVGLATASTTTPSPTPSSVSPLRFPARVSLTLLAQGPVPPATVNVTPTSPAPDSPDTGSPAPFAAIGPTTPRYIRVTGYGVVKHKPEEAHIAFLVSTTAASAVMALSSNAAQVQKVISGLKDHGVPEGNIIYSESSLINVPDEKPVPQASASPAAATPGDVQIDIPGSPPGQESPGPAKPAPQFTANARVEVVTYEVGDASSIVQIGMYAGATGVIAMTFEPRDLPEKKQEALILAMKDAANKAEILSVGIKSKILYVISVSEISAGAPATPGIDLAPPAEVAVPGSIEVIYAIG